MKIILTLITFCLGSLHVSGQSLRSVGDWEVLYQNAWQSEYNIASPQSLSNDSWQFYNLAYSIDANTCMFQATGNTIYLDRALYYITNVINSAQVSSSFPNSQFQDNYKGWVNQSHPQIGNDGKEYPLFESFCWRYVTTLLRIMKNSPDILIDASYNSKYQSILAFTELNIFNKWNERGANTHIYRSRTHMASHWARIGMDLWFITNDSSYYQVFDNFNNDMPNYNSSMRGQIISHPLDSSAYWWNSVWESFALPGQDVSHGNAVVAAIVEGCDMCLEYTMTDINALIKTFNIIFNSTSGSTTDYPEFIDGSGTGGGWFNDGFIKLGRYDTLLQQKIENHQIGQNTQLYGNGALNAKILLSGRPVYPQISCLYAPANTTQSSLSDLTIFPNPTSDFITITGTEANMKITLMNINSQELAIYYIKNGAEKLNIPVSNLPAGLYYVLLTDDDKQTIKKIIIQKP